MKNLIFIPAIILFSISLMSLNGGGDKCKFDYEKLNKFTGKTDRYNSVFTDNLTPAPDKPSLRFMIGEDADGLYISPIIMSYGQSHTSLQSTDTIYFKLENGSFFKVAPATEVIPTTDATTQFIYSIHLYKVKISKSDMTLLSKTKVVAFKYSLNNGSYTPGISEKQQDKLLKTGTCLLQ